MVLNNESCETYDWAFEKLCANEGSGWLNSETKFCQYSCWSNGVGYSDYSPCCPIDDEETDLLVAGGQFKMPPRPPPLRPLRPAPDQRHARQTAANLLQTKGLVIDLKLFVPTIPVEN